MEYIGQEHLKNSVELISKKGATILIGPDKYGKTHFAQQLAKELDLEYVLVESNVENTKALIQDISKGNLYHIKDLHNARPQVLSRLLKLLEDNIPTGAVIFITTEATQTIDTILSRCFVLKCKKYRYEELMQVNDIDKMLYHVYDTPTKLADIHEDIDKIVDGVEAFLESPESYKSSELGNYDYKLIANVLVTKLADKKLFATIQRVAKLAKGFTRNDYIPNWQVVHLLLEDVRNDLI